MEVSPPQIPIPENQPLLPQNAIPEDVLLPQNPNQLPPPQIPTQDAWGNRGIVTWFWAVTGVLSAMAACAVGNPKFAEAKLVGVFVGVSLLYAAAYALRHTPLFREKRGWVGTVMGNCMGSVVVVAVAVCQEKGPEAVVVRMLSAISAFAFMEVGKPVFDFGMTQFFLRLPLVTAIASRPSSSSDEDVADLVGLMALAVFILVLGTLWNNYFLSLFVEAEKEKRAVPAKQNRKGSPNVVFG